MRRFSTMIAIYRNFYIYLRGTAMKNLMAAVLMAAAMAGCSSAPNTPSTTEKAQPKAPETITGSGAFYKCYISARGWAPDAQPFRAESSESKTKDGKAGE